MLAEITDETNMARGKPSRILRSMCLVHTINEFVWNQHSHLRPFSGGLESPSGMHHVSYTTSSNPLMEPSPDR